METGATAAGELLVATLNGVPKGEHGYLLPARQALPVSFERVGDGTWLDGQIAMQARRWPTVDARVRATLWWYSVSQVFVTPALASLFVTGHALSPRPSDVELHSSPVGQILTARSCAVLDGDPVEAAAAALRESLDFAIPQVARAGAGREPPLWAIAADSLANRLLWLGRARNEVDRAIALTATLAGLIGSPLPAPRYVEVARHAPRAGRARFVRRASCCLVYLEPGETKCASCPRQTPAQRSAQLSAVVNFT